MNTHNSAALPLVDPSQVTHTVVASGNWSDPNTWKDGQVPTSGARIIVPQGTALTVDTVVPTEFKTLRIDGTLRFATDRNTELRVDTLVSSHMGKLEMGTAANPIASTVKARIVFADDGAIDRNWDPKQLSRGALLHGPVDIYGAEKTARLALAQHPRAGATTLQFNQAPVGWAVGDEMVITGTQGSTSDEIRTITAINGATVSLNQPLQLDHVAPKADLNVYVANTTRNVEFASENGAIAHRGHIMFMHNNNVNVNYAEFTDLGRTDKSKPLDDLTFEFTDTPGNNNPAPINFTTEQGPSTNIRGRYAVHFHRGGTTPNSAPATINGSVVMGSPGWGFVNHSSNVNITNNVAYGVVGTAYYTEVGDEIGSIEGNIAIRSVNPSFKLDDGGAIDPDLGHAQQEFGNDGDGYWLSGPLVSVKNNVSAGSSAHGFIFWTDGVVEADKGRATIKVSDIANGHLIPNRDTIPVWWAPLAEVQNNEAYGSTIGFRSRYIHSQSYLGEETDSAFHAPPPQAYIDTLKPKFEGVTVWDSRDGLVLNYNERLSVENARLIGTGAPFVFNGGTANTGVGLDVGTEVTRGPGQLKNISIEGFNMGLVAPRHDQWTIDNLTLKNTTDILIQETSMGPRSLAMSNITFGDLNGTAVADQRGQRRKIVLQADFRELEDDPTWVLRPDRITLDGQGLFFNQQRADFIPFPSRLAEDGSLEGIPNGYIGKTNQQLFDEFGVAVGGAVLPADAKNAGFVRGGVIGTAAPGINIPGTVSNTGTDNNNGDRIQGSADDDILRGSANKDILIGRAGDDILRGKAGNDKLKGGAGNDRLIGGRGDDVLVGGRGDDVLKGGSGNDRLVSGAGEDLLVGGGGSDRYVLSKNGFATIRSFNVAEDLF
ncbi:MAG: G8 domain-containing protein, partial [Cyanobacteria bacterium P01_F01_bin.150]